MFIDRAPLQVIETTMRQGPIQVSIRQESGGLWSAGGFALFLSRWTSGLRNTDDRLYRFTAGAASSGPQTSKLLQADDRGDRLDEDDLAESILSCRRESLCQLRTQLSEVRAAFLGMQRVGHNLDHISVLDQGDRILDVLPGGVTVWVSEDRTRVVEFNSGVASH